MFKKTNIKKTNRASSFSQIIRRRLSEGCALVFFSMSLFVLLILASHQSTDPAWSHSGVTSHIANMGGQAGALIADFLFYMFGYLAYLWSFLFIYIAWTMFRYKDQLRSPYPILAIRSAGFLVILLSSAGMISLLTIKGVNLPFGAGGASGFVVAKQLAFILTKKGAALALLPLLFGGVMLFSGLSALKILEVIGQKTIALLNGAFSLLWKLPGWLFRSKREEHSEFLNDPAEVVFPEDLNFEQEELKASPAINRAKLEKANEKINSQAKIAPRIERPAAAMPVPNVKKNVQKNESPLQRSLPLTTSGFPSLSLLTAAPPPSNKGYTNAELEEMSRQVEGRLLDFGVTVQVVAVHPGPVITRFEIQLAPGLKVSKISGLAKDLARSLSVISVRVVDVIPGKPVVGLELPNKHREAVRLREILASEQYKQASSPLSLAMGVDISGHSVVIDLAKTPHLLVAGTTGSGKSVGLNAMLLSLLFKASPEEVRLILIDPKMLELSVYADIPHLLTPVVTDMKEAANALRWSVAEMERRYQLMAALGVRNIAGYNTKVKEAESSGEALLDPLWERLGGEGPAPELQPLPFVVIVIDELADMMMVVGKKVEQLIARIAQKARAAGIHMILATQRPSVDVLTGLIKANIPTRMSFQVSSKIDSRTILDQQGAEQLLGYGDMLYLAPGTGAPVRVHGAFVDDHEVHKVASDWRKRGKPNYINEILNEASDDGENGVGGSFESAEDSDPLYDDAVFFITETRRASISSVQRKFKIGYNRAARLIEDMERAGIVSAMEGNGTREVLAPPPPKVRD